MATDNPVRRHRLTRSRYQQLIVPQGEHHSAFCTAGKLSTSAPAQRPSLRTPGLKSAIKAACTVRKSVRFQENLEQVRYFDKSDHPQAISKTSHRDRPARVAHCKCVQPLFTAKVEGDTTVLRHGGRTNPSPLVVKLDEFRVSSNPPMAVGTGTVKKSGLRTRIACRFTFDNWATQSEVAAKSTGCSADENETQDSFKFYIPISEHCDLGSNMMEFCLRYQVNNQDFWDNNNNNNYIVFVGIDRQESCRGDKITMDHDTGTLGQTQDLDKDEHYNGGVSIAGTSNGTPNDRDNKLPEALAEECEISARQPITCRQENSCTKDKLAPLIRPWPSIACGGLVGGGVEMVRGLGEAMVM